MLLIPSYPSKIELKKVNHPKWLWLCVSNPSVSCAHLNTFFSNNNNCFVCLPICSGDPTMFELYWLSQPQAPTIIPAWQGMSYFAHRHNSYLFLDYHLEQAIRALHDVVGNAVSQGRHIVLGVGSTQLFQATLYAFAGEKQSTTTPTSIISAAPFYSVQLYFTS